MKYDGCVFKSTSNSKLHWVCKWDIKRRWYYLFIGKRKLNNVYTSGMIDDYLDAGHWIPVDKRTTLKLFYEQIQKG